MIVTIASPKPGEGEMARIGKNGLPRSVQIEAPEVGWSHATTIVTIATSLADRSALLPSLTAVRSLRTEV